MLQIGYSSAGDPRSASPVSRVSRSRPIVTHSAFGVRNDMTRRRSDRLYVQIPLRVTGADAVGKEFEEETVSVNVNRHGACVTLTHALKPEQTVRIRNLRSGQEQDFRVVGMVRQVFGERAEWGVEIADPASDFWGVEFTPPPETIQPKVLIECQACAKVALVPLPRLEYDLLLHTGLISRHCDPCGETTRWRPSDRPPVAWTETQVAVDDDRRRTRRRRLAMHLQVRKGSGQSEFVQTMDVSKGGLCFFSKQNYHVGEQISVILPFGQEKGPAETKARIVWTRETAGGRLYGASLVMADHTALTREHMAQVA